MRLVSVTLKNFRCYQDETNIQIANLTALIGRNDIGKSTILEALEIFFNNSLVKIDQSDATVGCEDRNVEITCEFSDLPEELTLDAGARTTFADEYLLTGQGTLKIQKVFNCSKSKVPVEVFILALHPTADGASGLLELKEKELQEIITSNGLDAPLKGNPGMRKAIWEACGNLEIQETPIPISKPKEDSKRIWEQVEAHLPMFALFRSDRESKDSDGEVQTPLKGAIEAALSEVQDEIAEIQQKISEKATEIANKTHEALKSIDSRLAEQLMPSLTPPTPAKWRGLFSIGMDTTTGIPLNKRGSGVRRLILVSFFKAEAERRLAVSERANIIYAIEEPETSQHPSNQRILIEAFKSLSDEEACQVLLSTHSPGLAGELPIDCIRYVKHSEQGSPVIEAGADVFGELVGELGVTPDSRVRVLVCVEGPTDVSALKALSKALHMDDPELPDLSSDARFAFVPTGGSTLAHWVAENYLQGLGRPEFHLYDQDVPGYQDKVDEVNQRGDGSWGTLTGKHEIESYLHRDAIDQAFGLHVEPVDFPGTDGKAVPRLFAETYSAHAGHNGVMGDRKAKIKLAERAFPLMTAQLIDERDPDGEVRGWLRKLAEMANA